MRYLILLVTLVVSCTSPLERALILSGNNRSELEKVLDHYRDSGEKLKLKASEYLITNMVNKYCYEDQHLEAFDTIFHLFGSLYQSGIFLGDPKVITDTWDSLTVRYGKINTDRLNKKHDIFTIPADFLIRNIDVAFESWERLPDYLPVDFNIFCEYILPYRAGNEPFEEYRDRYFRTYHYLVDTASCVENLIRAFHQEFKINQNFRASLTLWDYPVGIPISKMEQGHRGACRHQVNYTALVMRACGLPVTVDQVIWANRSQGHEWNVLMLPDSGKFYPFDAFGKDRIEFVYQPAKIFRRMYTYDYSLYKTLDPDDVPPQFFTVTEKDVTFEYGSAFHVTVPIQYPYSGKKKRFGIICVFDNKEWRPVYWGKIYSGKMQFENMAANVVYMAAFWDQGEIIPATEPFLLDSTGQVRFFRADKEQKQNMRLARKYPLFKRIEDHAWGMRRTNFEAANSADFSDKQIFFSIYDIPFQIADSSIENTEKYRYVRFLSSLTRAANYAEIEFFGKKHKNAPEEKLIGKIIGYPSVSEDDPHPYLHAMDGNLETWFQKPKGTDGWVGLDLGKGNESVITRVRFCPRSDTNFILVGDTYELLYWDEQEWHSMGEQIAVSDHLLYENVPGKTLYLLKNHSRGKEERIFSYEDGKQVWW